MKTFIGSMVIILASLACTDGYSDSLEFGGDGGDESMNVSETATMALSDGSGDYLVGYPLDYCYNCSICDCGIGQTLYLPKVSNRFKPAGRDELRSSNIVITNEANNPARLTITFFEDGEEATKITNKLISIGGTVDIPAYFGCSAGEICTVTVVGDSGDKVSAVVTSFNHYNPTQIFSKYLSPSKTKGGVYYVYDYDGDNTFIRLMNTDDELVAYVQSDFYDDNGYYVDTKITTVYPHVSEAMTRSPDMNGETGMVSLHNQVCEWPGPCASFTGVVFNWDEPSFKDGF